MTNDTMPYVVIAVYTSIEIAHLYDLVVFRSCSESGIQRVIKAIQATPKKMCSQSQFLQGKLHREVWFH